MAALFLDSGIAGAQAFVRRTLIPKMSVEMAREPRIRKAPCKRSCRKRNYSYIQARRDAGPPHDRTFVSQVFAGMKALASGMGRTKKEAESQAAKTALDALVSKLRKRTRQRQSAKEAVEN
ncbi:MAG: putative dsRNA-binding protein [Slackia sp.]